ncbi:MAG TPA: hypothetical protein PLN61_02550 [bacterium]|nr:hypothetical protein [bacterium]HQI47518.1 hypothetical protein [bacterium]HQJ63095.1 hypothetical protein [bacterium]
MKRIVYLALALGFLSSLALGQHTGKDREREEQTRLEKPAGVVDRAGGTHNASNIGLFFENRGKLYPRRLTQGPSGEFPIGSGKNYIYRINPMIGIPGNIVQGRYTTDEEWEAVGGYHNPAFTRIAFSDNPLSWNPVLGWPVKDSAGNPVIKSDQDSYCVYDDKNNTVAPLGLEVHQTGYTFGVKFAQNLIFFKFEVLNKGPRDLDSLFFDMYCDIDIGDVSGGLPEYEDDKLDFDKANNFIYFYDDGFSGEWPGGITGYFGVAFLRTPKVNGVELGVTDMHYNLYNDDRDDDSLQYAIFSSNPGLIRPQSLVPFYFHQGNNPTRHFDDPATIPASGLDLTSNMASGPYHLGRGDTLTFYTAIIAGNNKEELYSYLKSAQKILAYNFDIAKPPATPTLNAHAGDGYVTLYWDDAAEHSLDNYSGEYDFEGYRIYRSVDKGLHWDQLNRNVDPSVGVNPVPIASYDRINNIGLDLGLQHSFTDTTVTNGYTYWYTITAYDRGDASVESLESPKGNSPDALNTVEVTPVSAASNRTPVSAYPVEHSGGKSNYRLNVMPVDADSLGERSYKLKFSYQQQTTFGTLKTKITPIISDSNYASGTHIGVEFAAPNSLHLIDLATGDYIGSDPRSYRSGITYSINKGLKLKIEDPDPAAAAQYLPKAGDYLSLFFCVQAIRNDGKVVTPPQPLYYAKAYATRDGVIFSLAPPEHIQSVSRIGGTDPLDITFSVNDAAAVVTASYQIATTVKGMNPDGTGFISLLITRSGKEVTVDSLQNGDTFDFDGLTGKVSFPAKNPPGPGNLFALETVVPLLPSLKDNYAFRIKGASLTTAPVRSDLERIRVVPNPYLVASLYEPEYGELRKEPLRQIQFINLPGQCSIYIYSVAGDRVKTIEHQAPNGTEVWDLRAEGGREIAPGIYLYIVKTAGAQYKNTFAVIK